MNEWPLGHWDKILWICPVFSNYIKGWPQKFGWESLLTNPVHLASLRSSSILLPLVHWWQTVFLAMWQVSLIATLNSFDVVGGDKPEYFFLLVNRVFKTMFEAEDSRRLFRFSCSVLFRLFHKTSTVRRPAKTRRPAKSMTRCLHACRRRRRTVDVVRHPDARRRLNNEGWDNS